MVRRLPTLHNMTYVGKITSQLQTFELRKVTIYPCGIIMMVGFTSRPIIETSIQSTLHLVHS